MNHKKTSKFLSLILRHRPEVIGIQLDENGWANVDELIEKVKQKGHPINREILDEVVATNNKKRFAFNDDGSKIRASQGHSIPVNLEMKPQKPPRPLYHGTASRFANSIRKQGLKSQSRNHVHLSVDRATAIDVGSRHGVPLILIIDTESMERDGIPFYLSANGVWLTEFVAPKYISFPQN